MHKEWKWFFIVANWQCSICYSLLAGLPNGSCNISVHISWVVHAILLCLWAWSSAERERKMDCSGCDSLHLNPTHLEVNVFEKQSCAQVYSLCVLTSGPCSSVSGVNLASQVSGEELKSSFTMLKQKVMAATWSPVWPYQSLFVR